jgi:hypothetical protein
MTPLSLTPDDLAVLKERSLTPAELEAQVALFRDPPHPVRLVRPATAGDGIQVLPEKEASAFEDVHRAACARERFVKFVPASGAATRMFDALLKGDAEAVRRFLGSWRDLPFREDLEVHCRTHGLSLEGSSAEEDACRLVRSVLGHSGLDLVHRPKALLPFHRYPGGSRTALEEHLAEAPHVVRDAAGVSRLHLTVSPEHRGDFERALPPIIERQGREAGGRFEVGISVQEPSSETLAVGEDDRPFRDAQGRLVFRPGGHGALLRNLARVEADAVLVKNIDNVVPDRLKGPGLRWKRVLAGLLVTVRDRVHSFLGELERGTVDAGAAADMSEFCRRWFFHDPWGSGDPGPAALRDWFDRPLRVCGMVRNTGEPGGGPYWVRGRDGAVTLQVVEKAQADLSDPAQREVFAAATHFNPVDLACSLRDPARRPYDLSRFSDPRAILISRKTLDGQTLKALEWPGLWNGAMHGWRTILVEVPLETFDPVKTVFDLLRPRHRPD